ncbi:Cfr10I/Bse634I family restriction endonuclease [Thalassobaculum sp. OXR-137]|uniref:Cfr10I/Bse634I family restriction endonuclease n=1 Tax=Thalassobaculum sp. OXR-137 TaxID=3100173 RepID=UPI002AC96029|nr:Cfr10I/Bse634I family restriction endonuclease [Thalassobaculum sp. OXR-137]WPZ35517.1 Cfr10I/Bse634I family restriction endonuclease [Thalassobaculum sp. OXR-137]
MDCAFEAFTPGTDTDPDPGRTFRAYRSQATENVSEAGRINFGADFHLTKQQLGKVDGDVFEILSAAAMWNAVAAWNRFMDGGAWDSTVFNCPPNAVPTPARKVAVVKLPRNFDTTRLFKEEVRRDIEAFQGALHARDLQLGLSSPDIVGVRLPHPLPEDCGIFLQSLPNLRNENRGLLESAHERIIGKLEGRSFLFAIAVKTSTRSDRLYQPLFEANVLKFLIGVVLRGAAFRFHVHMETFDGANVIERYKAAGLVSLLTGAEPRRAVDKVYQALQPTDTAQVILDDLPLFPL